jgi:hypothetical protein
MSDPFALSPYTFSISNERKGSDELGPDEVAPSNTVYAPLESPSSKDRRSSFPWQTTGHDQPPHAGPEELSTNEIVKPNPTHKAYTSADRKSANASIRDIPTSSPFSEPSYDCSSSANRTSAHIGPYDLSTISSFSRLSYTSPSKANRISRHIAPDENSASQKPTDDGSPTSINPDLPIPTQAALPMWKSLGPEDWDSSNVSPGAANVTTSDEIRDPLAYYHAAGGAVDSKNPFSTSTNYFAKRPGILKTTSRADQFTPGTGFSNRASRNFSKKMPSIMIPENTAYFGRQTSVGESPSSGAMKDTPIQTPVRSSFASTYERKKSHSNSVAFAGLAPPIPRKESRFNSVSVTDISPLTSRQPSASTISKQASIAYIPSTATSRRPSLAAGPRRSSVSVTNVVIPAHLMTHVETNWNEDKIVGRRKSAFQREDSRKSFNIQSMAQQQQEEIKSIINTTQQAPRFVSPSMEELAQANPFTTMRERKISARKSRGKSLAAVDETEKTNDDEEEEEEIDDQLTPDEPPEGLNPFGKFAFNYRDVGISPGAGIDPADPLAAAGAVLAPVTSNNNSITAARRPSMWRHSAAVNVHAPSYNGQRRPSVFQRAGSVFQDTVQTVRKKVRRSSMWDVYENAKKRQLEIRRKRWVQVVFEYSFYFMLVVLVYFLIIGQPLWKGTYLSLYLGFKYKLNLNGSWSIIIAVAVA